MGSKLFIAFFAGIVAFVCIVGVLSYQISKGIIVKQAQTSFEETIAKTGENVVLTLDSVVSASKKLAVDKTFAQNVQQLRRSNDTSERIALAGRIADSFRSAQADSSVIGSIAVLYDGGGVTSEGKGVAGDAYQAEWVAQAVQANGQPLWLASQGEGKGFVKTNDTYKPEPSILLARLIRNPQTGEDAGVLAIEVKLKSLAAGLGGVAGASLFVLDGNGRFVYHPDYAKLAQPSGIGTGEGADAGAAGGKQIVAEYPLEGTGWSLVGTVPQSLLTKDTVRIAQVTVYAAFGAAVFAALLGWAVVRMIARPVTSITKLMERAAGGDLTGRAPQSRRKDEIGKLGAHFNEMMANTSRLIRETVESAASVFETAAYVEQESRQNASSASHIADSTRGISEGAVSLAADAERGVVLAEEIMGAVGGVIEANGVMEAKAAEVRRAGEEGQLQLRNLSETTGKVEEANRAINERMAALSRQTASVAELLEQLNRLARQTNILSLNASIEASRVGALGKGFQVIAQEMGNLAKESESNLGRVAEWMQSMAGDIQGTTEEMDRAKPWFEEQFKAIVRTENLIGEVGSRMVEFEESLNETTEKIRKMNSAQQSLQETIMSVGAVSEQSTASVQEVAAMTGEQAEISSRLVEHAQRLAALSERLKELLIRFRV
ncbi:methyl-accepting chemotaxis protein [Cohnella thermotolerans]|uniref:methyl-accepting chemotaxis protein n=1 Tax=Cohnella thermotolerans TaxID=329858 RepID=UPI00146FBA0A|nr:methyl-accepting chemotaxis protein [Cohnella thermotolerans]